MKLHICRVIGKHEAKDEENALIKSVLEYLTFNENNPNDEEFLVANLVKNFTIKHLFIMFPLGYL